MPEEKNARFIFLLEGEISLTRKFFPLGWITILVTAISLAGCALAGSNEPLPTLVPTLAIVVQPSTTASIQPAEIETFTPAPLDAVALETISDRSATETITPWDQDTNTPGPSPTATRSPTMTRTPTRTRSPSRTPTITFTPTPPAPAIYLVRPGLLSRVVSPIEMELYAYTGGDGKISIELVGEDGRVISRQVMDYGGKAGRHVWIIPKLPFEIDAAAETARLQVSTKDEFGRLEWLSSVNLVLLSMGRSEINPPAITQASYLIRRPKKETTVSGGLLVVSGLARPVNDSPLILELLNENGGVLLTKQLVVPPPTGELSHTPFSVEIPYHVSQPVPVRLTLYQQGSRIPGIVELASEELILEP